MQFCKQLPCCARKIARKVASKSNFPNPSCLDIYCMDFYCAQLYRPVSPLLSLREGVARSLDAFILERLSYKDLKVRYLKGCSSETFAAQITLLFTSKHCQYCVVKTIHIFLTLNKLNNII